MQFIEIIQVTTSVLLVVSILLQNRGSSLGSGFGGGDAMGSFHTKRGFEQFLVRATIALAVIFLLSSLARVWMS